MSTDHEKVEAALRDSFVTIKKLRNQVKDLELVQDEPIAIIGMACRLPGNVNTPEEYWQLLINNQSGIIDIPSTRWDIDTYYDADKDSPGKMYVRKGGFLQTPIDEFDAELFHISPREAEDMDPQQRLALEVAYEAIEQAGIKPADLMRTATGVYMGICFNDYGHLITESHQADAVDNYYSTGNHYSVLSGRISYYFGLQGPSISMDTACSSSLVTLDAAVKDLRLKRCNLALAGGVNLMLAPEPTISFCKSGMLSPEGQCNTFDASADGYVRGEGCGILVLKRLSDALADNDTILALIRGTAVNQDGPSSGLTVPNGLAQEQVIKAALANAKINPNDVSYVEAHGTGTSLGDPIELEALKNSYTKERDQDKPLRVGSVKTNIGHTEAVAGVASVMKVVLALMHEKIPATLHFKTLNPSVDLSNTPLEIASKNTDWPRGDKRMAGISSFGFSGTNAHVILEEGPSLNETQVSQLTARTQSRHLFRRQRYWARVLDEQGQVTGKKALDSWFHRIEWIESSVDSEKKESAEQRNYLVFSTQQTYDLLADRSSVTWVGPQQALKDVDAFAHLFDEKNAYTDIIYCADFDMRCEPLLYLIQALVQLNLRPKLWVFSVNAQVVTGKEVDGNPLQSTLLGFAKVIALEHPELRCVRVDFDHMMSSAQCTGVLDGEGTEDEIAIRDDKRYVPRLMNYLPQERKLVTISSEGTYLITGGLGGLGLACVEWLVGKGAKHFVLLGRSAPKSHAQEQLNRYLDQGVSIALIAGDISQKSDVEQLFETIGQHAYPLKGIIHAAGVVDPDFITQLSWARFAKVLAPKVDGTINLCQAIESRHLSPDFFVLFSSISGVLGSASMSSYAAGNYFLTQYANFARQRGVPMTSIAWGPWSDVGMASKDDRELRLGYQLISPQEGIKAMEMALNDDEISPVVAPMQWKKYFENLQYIGCIYANMAGYPQTVHADELESALQNLAPEHLDPVIKEYIRRHVKSILGLEQHAKLDDKKGFFELGMDSLMATELRNTLQKALASRATLKSTVSFDYPNVEALSHHVMIQLGFHDTQSIEQASKIVSYATTEPIAIIGLGCRLPSGATTPEAFWQVLKEGVEGISDIPLVRFDSELYYDPEPGKPNKIITKKGAFIEDIDLFDPTFFGISPIEADTMDPQQRLLLHVTWEALEYAGIAPSSLAGSLTGVFIGVSSNEYGALISKNTSHLSAHFASGNALNALAGRLSYCFGLQGPSLIVDTACSSSLVGLHTACKSLLAGDCTLAIAGGANIILDPSSYIALSAGQMLSPDGHCKTFDASADGYARGEGIGVLILKLLSDAERDGDRVLAVIKGSAVNQDGPSSGLTVPSGVAQASLMREALSHAKLTPLDITYVEAHGTGTSLGDPIEVNAIAEVYGESRAATEPLLLGSVKSNIGHLESAAGMSSMIKMILALQHKALPGDLHFKTLNPKIDLNAIPAQIVTQFTLWSVKEGQKRIAGISGFGFTGTNAHIILEEAPIFVPKDSLRQERSVHLLVLSAKSQKALNQLVVDYQAFLETSTDTLADITFTAATGRNHESFRLAVIASTIDELKVKLSQMDYVSGEVVEAGRIDIEFKYDELAGYRQSAVTHGVMHIGIGLDVNWVALFEALAVHYVAGAVVNWMQLDVPFGRKKISLPTYPFEYASYWSEFARPKQANALMAGETHPFLARRLNTPALKGIVYESTIDFQWPEFVSHHLIYGAPVIAGAGYISALLSIIKELDNTAGACISDLNWIRPLVFNKGESSKLQIILQPEEGDSLYAFEVISLNESDPDSQWLTHATGLIKKAGARPLTNEPIESIKARLKTHYTGEFIYQEVPHRVSLDLGPHFRWIEDVHLSSDELLAQMRLPEGSDESVRYLLYPGFIDSVFQTGFSYMLMSSQMDMLSIPLYLAEAWYDQSKGYPRWVHAHRHLEQGEEVWNYVLLNENSEVVGGFNGFRLKAVPKQALLRAQGFDPERLIYESIWEEHALDEVDLSPELGSWLILGDGELSLRLHEALQSEAIPCERIPTANLPQTKEAFEALLDTMNAQKPLAGLLHTASADDFETLNRENLSKAQALGCESVLHLTQALIAQADKFKFPLFLITREITSFFNSENIVHSPLNGLFKTILAEHPELMMKHIDLTQDFTPSLLSKALFVKDEEMVFALTKTGCYVPRLFKSAAAQHMRHELTRPLDDQFKLAIKEKGLLDHLELVPLVLKKELAPHEVEVDMHCAGLNFRDVLNALDLYPGDPGPLGGDGSGIITQVGADVSGLKPGDSVVGMMMGGCLSRIAQVHKDTLTLKPASLSFAQAAALPTVCLTVHYAFTRCMLLKKGDTVLIHAGTGGVGQAAIQWAMRVGAHVIVTAGSEKKRDFLKAQGVAHVFDSRSLSYGKDIERVTQGKGVDVVLNSLSGEGFIETSLSVCRKGAHFLEIGKRNIWTPEAMKAHRADIDYHLIAIDEMALHQPEMIQVMLKEFMPLFETGELKPLPMTLFPIEEAIAAFKYMHLAKNIGKVVIDLSPKARIEDKINPQATYLITGGLGGLGLTLAHWLGEKGATHLVLTGRRALDEATQALINTIESPSLSITYEAMDIGDPKAVEQLMFKVENSAQPLKGIFHLAGVLEDATLMEQDWSHFETVFRPKIYGSYYLHHYSKNLDLFVMFSSISSSLGSPGQSNYAAANAFMDALCEHRKHNGLSALSVSWGPWAEVGMAKDLVARHAKGGMLGIKPKEGMQALEAALLSNQPHLTVVNMNWPNYLKSMIEAPTWLEAFAQKRTTKENLAAQLEITATNERLPLVKHYVVEVVRAVIGLSASQALDEKKGFFDMGLDSLMAIELKNRLQAGIGKSAILATTAVFDHSSIEKMTNYVATLLNIENLAVRKKEEPQMALQPDEPIAIIGMSCRFPGGANSPQACWELLERGGDAIREIPTSRWDADSFYDPDPAVPGKMITKLGGFLDLDVSEFDAGFFNISPREAEYLDPQQRLLLEVSYEAILSTGIDKESLEGSLTGVFMGLCSSDYMDLITATGDMNLINPYLATGNAASTATGRISYTFDFQGPNFAIDTACSSSLVAIDEACKSLRSGDSNLALAGGVNLILAPNLTIDFSKAGMLAIDGHCKTFDASADGYVRGEGCGVIVLKRLSEALRDGNPILAVIKASGVNQDGASSGLTVPNGDAQESLIRKVLNKAKLKPSDIDYVEAHGTGTSLGDPIEVRALGATYGQRDITNPLKLGSIKTNIGHLEGAAGIAGVIKVILAMQHETLPAHLHFKQLNPHIDANFPLEIVTKNQEWARGEHIRRAGISSFGFSGTNAHLILEEGPKWSEAQQVQWQTHALTGPDLHREKYWAEAANIVVGRKLESVHPLLGEFYSTPDNDIIYRGELHLRALGYLRDHQVYGHVIYPGAGYLEMMLASGFYAMGEGIIQLSNVSIEAALSIDVSKLIESQVVMKPIDAGYEVAIYSGEKNTWQCHARGTVCINEPNGSPQSLDITGIKSRCEKQLTQAEFYDKVNNTGIHYGPCFQALTALYVGQNEALGELHCPSALKGYLAHPSILDGALQLLATNLSTELFLPIGCDEMTWYAPLPERLFAHWKEIEQNNSGRTGNISFCTETGVILATITGMHYRKTTEQALKHMLAHETGINDLLYEWTWQEVLLEKESESLGHCLVLGDGKDSDAIIQYITQQRATSQLISKATHPKTKEEFSTLIQSQPFSQILHLSSIGTPTSIAEAQAFGAQSLLFLTQALVEAEVKIPLTLITGQDLAQSPLDGLYKTIIAEHPELEIKRIDLEEGWTAELVTQAIASKSDEQWLRLKDKNTFVPRFLRARDAQLKRHELTRPADDHFRLQSKQKGLLDDLTLAPLALKTHLDPQEVEVEVRAVGLNFRDVLDALGLYPGDPGPLGGDGAGVIRRVGAQVKHLKPGDEIFGMMSGALSRLAWVHEDNITNKPSTLNFANAAALPTVFLTVYYAFTRSTVLKAGDTVLIHAGAGGVGQAAIQMAQYIGANIIATAGSEEKRAFLKAQGVERVFDSRHLTYGKDIETLTQGRGVDVVLNSLSGEGFIETSLSCCSQNARFLEIGKRDIWTKEQMSIHRPDIDYHIIALDDISQTNPETIQAMLQELLPLFEQNKLHPLPIESFPIENAIQAFAYMQTAKHIGKIVIEQPKAPSLADKIHSDATYLITGGLGGLGLTLAHWLAERGAGHIVLTGRRGAPDEDIKPFQYESLDMGDEEAVKALITRLNQSEKPLKGIFHLAGVLDDATLMEQDWTHFETVFRPKVYGSYYLHQHSKDLDLFVLFSSVASSLGSPGQSNYAAANAFMDALCEHRTHQGLPALSVSWGPWADVGMAKDLVVRHAKGGMLGMKPKEGMQALEAALLSNQPHLTVVKMNWLNYIKSIIEAPTWLEAFMRNKISKDNLISLLDGVPESEQVGIIKNYTIELVRSVLGLSADQTLDDEKGFFDMGLDSLMAIELKNRLQAALGRGIVLGATVVFDYSSIEKMVNHLCIILMIGSKKVNPVIDRIEIYEEKKEEQIKKAVYEMSFDELCKALKSEQDKP